MKVVRHLVALAALSVSLLAPVGARAAGEIVINPFGTLDMKVLTEPSGATPGTARLTIATANGAVTGSGARVYFGLRIMGSEGIQMTGFRLTGSGACIVSDFAGTNTPNGWQGNAVFGASAPGLGSLNSNMRMIGGSIKKSCGDVQIDLSYPARPLVAFYAAFFGLTPAPWHESYGTAPWSTIPTGGNHAYDEWWDLWGTFDTLGYSNACTNLTGVVVTCG